MLFKNKSLDICVSMIMAAAILMLMNSCTLLQSVSGKQKSEYDYIGFFTNDNKPTEYTIAFHILSESADLDNGINLAQLNIERQIRETAVSITPSFNGVILLKPDTIINPYQLKRSLLQRYIPINYDQEKYQAPLTEYQKSRKINYNSSQNNTQ